jgi:hypothetical protein
MTNVEGFDFREIGNVPGLVLLSNKDPAAVLKIVSGVQQGIFDGVLEVLKD